MDNKDLYERETFANRKNNNTKEYGILLIFLLIIISLASICYFRFDDILKFFENIIEEFEEDYDYDYTDDDLNYDKIDECYGCYIDQTSLLENDLEIASYFFEDYFGIIDEERISEAGYYDGVFILEYVTYVYEDGTYDSVYAETHDFENYVVAITTNSNNSVPTVEYINYAIKDETIRSNIMELALQMNYYEIQVTDENITGLLNYLLSIEKNNDLAVLINSGTYKIFQKSYSDYSIDYKFVDTTNNNNYIYLSCSFNCVEEWSINGSSIQNNFGSSSNVSYDGIYYNLDYSFKLDENELLDAKRFVGNKYE